MKKILIIFSICALAATAGFSQDDVYYTGDEATVTVKAQTAPPPLPTYVQPPCPYDGYLWSPGYWAWGPAGYYWVPGVWVRPPHHGLLWTPGYWGFYGGYYGWHGGYWGAHVGYYGGVCYGFGYGGLGFYGGRWAGGVFSYNTAVWHVNTTVIHNTYVSNEGVRPGVSRASFNGPGGIKARPSERELQTMRESHQQATSEQLSHQQSAGQSRSNLASVNHGTPATAAMNRTGGQRFNSAGVARTNASRPATGSNGASRAGTTARPGGNNMSGRPQPSTHSSGNPQQSHSGSTPRGNTGHAQPRSSSPRGGGGGHGGGGERK